MLFRKRDLTSWSTDSKLQIRKGLLIVDQQCEAKRENTMIEYKLGEIEMRFADIIWNHEPLSSGDLVKLCEKELEWKKSTTYTILRRVCERGLFKNENGMVTSCVSKEEFLSNKTEQFVEETFAGSLPSFVAAFTNQRKLSDEEIRELQLIIERNRNA